MMIPNVQYRNGKKWFIEDFDNLWQLEEAITTIKKNSREELQLSILGRLAITCISTNKGILASKEDLKTYWQGSLGPSTDLALFCHPKMGTLFIVGSLVKQFLQDLDGRFLGSVPSGPHAILRGLGISENETIHYLELLNDEQLLLLIRALPRQYEPLRPFLKRRKVME